MPKIRVHSLAHVHYQHPDLKAATQFLTDFGFRETQRTSNPTRVYYRGSGTQPYLYVAEQSPDSDRHFLGATWNVGSAHDLDIAASLQCSVTGVVNSVGPGGGSEVTLKDPVGFAVSFIHGQKLAAELPHDVQEQEINFPDRKPRLGRFLRFKHGPSEVHKFGHYGIMVPQAKFTEVVAFYQDLINLVDSDTNFNAETGEDQLKFMHIDKGKEYSDHHSFFVGVTPTPTAMIHHSSFEVHNMDTQLLGHYWLQEKGYRNAWGVGRHVLGSQIFDYWFDESGFIMEHYSDGDMLNSDSIPTREAAGKDTLHIWGPNVPIAFLTAQAPERVVQPPDIVTAEAAKGIAPEFLQEAVP